MDNSRADVSCDISAVLVFFSLSLSFLLFSSSSIISFFFLKPTRFFSLNKVWPRWKLERSQLSCTRTDFVYFHRPHDFIFTDDLLQRTPSVLLEPFFLRVRGKYHRRFFRLIKSVNFSPAFRITTTTLSPFSFCTLYVVLQEGSLSISA